MGARPFSLNKVGVAENILSSTPTCSASTFQRPQGIASSVLAVLAATRNKDRCARSTADKRSEGQPTTGNRLASFLLALRVLLNERIRQLTVLSISGHN